MAEKKLESSWEFMITHSELTEGNFFKCSVGVWYMYTLRNLDIAPSQPAAFSNKAFIKGFHCLEAAAERA